MLAEKCLETTVGAANWTRLRQRGARAEVGLTADLEGMASIPPAVITVR
jgi:hypothetical protein